MSLCDPYIHSVNDNNNLISFFFVSRGSFRNKKPKVHMQRAHKNNGKRTTKNEYKYRKRKKRTRIKKSNKPNYYQRVSRKNRHLSNSRSCELDFIPYKIIKLIYYDYHLVTILLNIINNIYNLASYPDQLHISKLFLLKKKPVVSTSNKLRAINPQLIVKILSIKCDIIEHNIIIMII